MFLQISPTVINAYITTPEWFNELREDISLNGKKLNIKTKFDIHGYDCWGYNANGKDRAGYTTFDYTNSATCKVEGETFYALYEEIVEKFTLEVILDNTKSQKSRPLTVSNNFIKGEEEKISKIENLYKAKFVAYLPLKTSAGDWSETPSAIFYQEVPPKPEYSNYFAVFTKNGKNYITSGESAVEGYISGIKSFNGKIIYSSCRHDLCTSADGSVWIDGGRDYTRSNGATFSMQIKNGKFYQV